LRRDGLGLANGAAAGHDADRDREGHEEGKKNSAQAVGASLYDRPVSIVSFSADANSSKLRAARLNVV
jgi:hypothetical protein